MTNKSSLEHLYTFGHFPVFIGAVDQEEKDDLFADLSISICKDTGFVQLDTVLPPTIVYSSYHSEALGSVWKEHHEKFVQFLSKYQLSQVLEIGGGNGRLAVDFLKHHPDVCWKIIEPNPVEIQNDRVEYIPKLFDEHVMIEDKFDAIIHSHAFEHMYDPRMFLKKISQLLDTGGFHIFSVPNLFTYLEQKFTNVLNFEHTIFLSEYFIDYLLAQFGFEIIEKKYFGKHSIFYATKKTDKPLEFNFQSQYLNYKKIFQDYFQYNRSVVKGFNSQIERFEGSIYLFGAHVFSQYLIHQGLLQKNIVGVLDNSLMKQGKRLYGTSFSIESPEILRGKPNTAIILRAGDYQDEIKKQITSINPNTVIWE